MARIIHAIGIEQNICNNIKFRELKKDKALTDIINNLLKGFLKINEEEIPKEKEALNEELFEIESKKTLILKRLEEIEAAIPKLTDKEKAEGWEIMNGKKVKVLFRGD